MDYMARALQLAGRALGRSSPNPAVGAVLVRDNRVVGEGWTRPPGQSHAEVVALDEAGDLARGAALYVTLEPCPHHGRTPPCVDAIIAAGVLEVHMATLDPSPWVAGGGKSALQAAGLGVVVGESEREARRLNEAYLIWVARGRPLLTAVYAMNLNGSLVEGELQDVLGAPARDELERLKQRADRSAPGHDSRAFDADELATLGAEGVTSLIVECGRSDLGRLLASNLADKFVVFVIPTVGADVNQSAVDAAPSATPLHDLTYERLDADLMVVGYTAPCSPAS